MNQIDNIMALADDYAITAWRRMSPDLIDERQAALRTAIEQSLKDVALSAQHGTPGEPVAWIWKYANGEEEVVFVPPRHIDATYVDAPSTITPLYTAPQPQQWVGLTDEEIGAAYEQMSDYEMYDEFARAIEAKLREKNGGGV